MTTPGVLADRSLVPAVQVSAPVRDRAADLLCFLLGVGVVVLTYFDSVDPHIAPVLLAVDLTLGGLSCLGIWVRRRWPVGFAVVAGLVNVVSASAAGAGMIALFTVAVHRRFAVVGPVVAGYALIPLANLLVRPDIPAPPWSHVLVGILCALTVLALGMVVRARRQSLHERKRRIKSEHESLVSRTRQHERNQIAREMHDVLAHRLSLLSLHAGALELRPGAQPEEVARAAGVIRASAYQALEDLREVIGVLRTDQDSAGEVPERPQPTLADLPELVDQSRRAGIRVRLDCQGAELAAVPAAVGRSAYRIVQEGLTNAHKHARDAEVSVTVRMTVDDGLTVEIRNPCPTNFTADIPGGGAGLIGLAERVVLAGGQLQHGRTTEGDFRLWAWLPWRR